MLRLRILADDLSGAADCAASFTGAVGATPLLLRDRTSEARSFAVDADSRMLDASAAAARWCEIAASHSARDFDSLLFKKIDSTLRGHVAEELSAFLEALTEVGRVVVAPAFPEQGRTFVDGRLHVHGTPQDAELKPLRERLEQTLGTRALVMPMTIASQDDLVALVREMRESNERTLWVGSSGLARALAGAPPRRIEASRLQAPRLFVVGSFSAAAREQVRAFARRRPGQAIAISPRGENLQAGAAKAADVLQASGAALIHFYLEEAAPAAPSRRLVAELAAALRACARRSRTLVMTGGDTARAMLEALGVDALTIEGEIEPGVAVSAPVDGHGFRAVLKAGGFGDNGVFLRLHP